MAGPVPLARALWSQAARLLTDQRPLLPGQLVTLKSFLRCWTTAGLLFFCLPLLFLCDFISTVVEELLKIR